MTHARVSRFFSILILRLILKPIYVFQTILLSDYFSSPVLLSFPCVFISHTGTQILWFQTLFYVIELIHLPPFPLRWELERQTLWVHVCLLMEWTLQVETVLMRTKGVEQCPFLTWLLKQMFSCLTKTTHPLILFLLRDQSSFLSTLLELIKEQLKINWSVESLRHYRQIGKNKNEKINK